MVIFICGNLFLRIAVKIEKISCHTVSCLKSSLIQISTFVSNALTIQEVKRSTERGEEFTL